MIKNNIENSIHDYVATHEVIITQKVHKIDENLDVKFTRWGNSVARKCLIEVISVCDDVTKKKIIKMMDSKRTLNL
jgi:hypothetical protein